MENVNKILGKEQKTEKAATKTSVLVLEIDGVTVTKDATCYTVTGGLKNRYSYFSNLESAMQEVADRLFHEKLTQRAQEKKSDIQSLIELIKEQKRETIETLKLMLERHKT